MTFNFTRRKTLGLLFAATSATLVSTPVRMVFAAEDQITRRFALLSTNGNSNCSGAFRDSIASMPDDARLQGSCCGPMVLHRYREQIEGLRTFVEFAEVPPDPYDVEAGLAKRLLASYSLELSPEQQADYDLAVNTSAEKGPCCCPCWRWNVFGGLGRVLIRDRGFDGAQVAKLWDLANGCGGDSEAT